MRDTAFTLVLGLAGLLAGPASAAAPYPSSTSITGVTWDASSYRWDGAGGDIWPITWSAEGRS